MTKSNSFSKVKYLNRNVLKTSSRTTAVYPEYFSDYSEVQHIDQETHDFLALIIKAFWSMVGNVTK